MPGYMCTMYACLDYDVSKENKFSIREWARAHFELYILTKKSACVSPVPRELEGDSRVADNLFGRETLKSC